MEINVNFVLFDELTEKLETSNGFGTHIVIIRQSENSNLTIEDCDADSHNPLD